MLGTFLTIDATNTAQILTYTKELITDISPIWIIIVAVGIGTILLSAIISAIKK